MLTARVLNLLALAFTGEMGPAEQFPLGVGATSGASAARVCCLRRLAWCLRCRRRRRTYACEPGPSPALVNCARLPSPLRHTCFPNPPTHLLLVAMSALLLLYVNWGALQSECLRKDTCDIFDVRG